MSEQITLFDETLTPETLGGKLEDILEAAREKSGYYRLHESGMYEMMKGAPASEGTLKENPYLVAEISATEELEESSVPITLYYGTEDASSQGSSAEAQTAE